MALIWVFASESRTSVPSHGVGTSTNTAPPDTETLATIIETADPEGTRSTISSTAEAVHPQVSLPLVGPPQPSQIGTIRISGTVQDRHAGLLTSAHVRLLDEFGRELVAAFDSARYEFDRLRPGEYILQCQVEGFEDEERRVLLAPGEEKRIEDFVLDEAWILTVHILAPDGRRLRDWLRQADWFRPQAIAPHASIDPPGPSLPPTLLRDQSVEGVARRIQGLDRIHISVEPPIHVSVLLRNQVLATQRVKTKVPELTFVISPADIEAKLGGIMFCVVDGYTNLPVPSAIIHANTADSTEVSLRLDGEGCGRFQNLLPGLYEVEAWVMGRALFTKLVEVEPEGILDLGVISLMRGVTVSGHCLDDGGIHRRVVGGLVPLREVEPGRSELSNGAYSFVSDEDGRFVVPNLPPGRFLVQVPCRGITVPQELSENDWTAKPILIDTTDGPVSDVIVSLHLQAQLVLRPTSSDLTGMNYRVMTPDRITLATGTFKPWMFKRTFPLAPGSYILALARGRQQLGERSFVIGEGTTIIDVSP